MGSNLWEMVENGEIKGNLVGINTSTSPITFTLNIFQNIDLVGISLKHNI